MPDLLTVARMPNQEIPTSAWGDGIDQICAALGAPTTHPCCRPTFSSQHFGALGGRSSAWAGAERRSGRGFYCLAPFRPRGNPRPPCAFTLRPKPGRWTDKPWPIRWPPNWPSPPCGSTTPGCPTLSSPPITFKTGWIWAAPTPRRPSRSGGFNRRCGWWRTSILPRGHPHAGLWVGQLLGGPGWGRRSRGGQSLWLFQMG